MPSRPDIVLADLAEITTQVADLDRRRDGLVARARHAGATWQQIAHALDISAQAAHKRYRHLRYDPTTGRALAGTTTLLTPPSLTTQPPASHHPPAVAHGPKVVPCH